MGNFTPKIAISEMFVGFDSEGNVTDDSLMFIKYGSVFDRKTHCKDFQFCNVACEFVDRNVVEDGRGFFIGAFGDGEDLSTYTGKRFDFKADINGSVAIIEVTEISDVDIYFDEKQEIHICKGDYFNYN